MIIRTLLPALFLTGCVSGLNTASADGFGPLGHPDQRAVNTPLDHPANKPDFESQIARSFDDLVLMVEAESLQIEGIQKITLVVKYENELTPRYLIHTPKDHWRASQRTR